MDEQRERAQRGERRAHPEASATSRRNARSGAASPAGKTARASTCGACRLPGTVVLVRSHAATSQPAASTTKVDALAKRVAVISDVHANWQALEAVLEEIEREQPDELWCLGDLVGYGPRPNPCCAAVERRAAFCLAGNHDLGVLGEIDLEEFAGDAVVAARWTRGVLAESSRTFLQSLRPLGERDGVRAVPREPARPGLGVRALARTPPALRSS